MYLTKYLKFKIPHPHVFSQTRQWDTPHYIHEYQVNIPNLSYISKIYVTLTFSNLDNHTIYFLFINLYLIMFSR